MHLQALLLFGPMGAVFQEFALPFDLPQSAPSRHPYSFICPRGPSPPPSFSVARVATGYCGLGVFCV